MNWLAHVFLSEQNIDFQIGNYLADPLKGKVWDKANKDLVNGIKVHMIIDSFTDSNKIVKKSKNRLRDSGLLKSIIIDITYDYFLSKNWDRFSTKLLSRDSTSSYYQAVSDNIEDLEKDFLIFFPELCEEVRKNVNSEKINHWKI